jgi:hypothetical protein
MLGVCKLKVRGINVFGLERQRRGMFIAFEYPTLSSSGGATYQHLDVAPPELERVGYSNAINIRLLRSRSETIDNNRLQFAQVSSM